ncbi:ABC transporter substrate-binding protein [Cohnella sp. REN36]|uniref:ABC transporter substrate-binding protein n=1 Tax=Cohnella sp. REN36 TaxID=2887347 RepID=UPI001D149C74|nr:extracellular solute-binding protein [Cohnella sp. REN36]MCC3375198.1 extracellular solute-binding protein [Cohnella sp. REN36]
MKKQANGWKTGALILLCAAMTACAGGKDKGGAGGTPAAVGSETEKSNGKTVVTMSVLTKDRFLAEAEQKFEAAHPDIDIVIDELVPMDTSEVGGKMVMRQGGGGESEKEKQDAEKYANNVNTAIMSGNAADIISVENLPFDKYAEKGLLADWNALAEKDGSFRKSDYYENIFKGLSKGDGWYGIPVSFTLDVMLGNAELLKQNQLDDKTWTWDQFVDLLDKTKTEGKYGLAAISPESLLGYLVGSVYGQVVKNDGKSWTFDADAFEAYLEKIKKLYDTGMATSEMMGPDTANFNQMNMNSPMDVVLMPQMGDKSRAMLRPPGIGQDEGIPFKSGRVLGLNAKSKAQDAAWSFVKFLLSEEMQSSMSLMQFPVNQAALQNKLVETKNMLEGKGGGGGIQIRNKDGTTLQPKLSDEDITRVVNLMPSVSKYSNQNPKVLAMIAEESAAYFSGSKSADAVAKSLASRIGTYLNE